MTFHEQKDTVKVLYAKFSLHPYVPATYWTTAQEFTLDPLYQQPRTQYVHNALFNLQQPEFVLDTSLVPPPGIEPGSSDFQSGA